MYGSEKVEGKILKQRCFVKVNIQDVKIRKALQSFESWDLCSLRCHTQRLPLIMRSEASAREDTCPC